MNHYQILIIGGGNAGLSVASQLLLKNKNLQIGIVEPSEKHYYQPAWTLVGAGAFDIAKTEKKEADYIPQNTTWIKEAVVTFSPEKNTVACTNGTEITYDYLVVCPGIQLDWKKIDGLTETLGKNEVSSNYSFNTAPYTWELIKNFKGGTAVFTNPATPIKCGGAPHKIMYLACDYWRKKGILDQCDVHYVSGAGVIFGVPEYAETLKKKVAQYNIKVHFGANVTAIDGKSKTIFFESKEQPKDLETKFSTLQASCYGITENQAEASISKVSLNFDICHTVPPQSAPDFIKKSPLADANNPLGYVEIDKHTMQHSRFKNIFALGDCTNAPCSKTGAAIRKQAPVVVENLLQLIANHPVTASYDGYSACPIPTQYGKLMLAEFDYSNKPKMTFPFDQAKPRWTMWILKTKILPWLYWNKILKGTA
ncbi:MULTISPECIES: FAD/NAD(P)-binding oxidoreductase [Flavobacterium]|uniref:NAD(P)/FAD-dependent oxidoreductase n=1 Tax=Flavobacterium keumense TaxID=1306518 RepID=A0ABY8N445_9FLAO|nr:MULTISPECIES: FAD/NAD(P)-binding oxidoreductase [Flavobacterium]WGK94420.1 NAD(P)/FAD-dependent oxidoreductase [Flavobacterium keumense]